MKKFLKLTLGGLMALSLVACGGDKVALVDKLTTTYTSDPERLDYVVTALAVDHDVNTNLVDGLLENDRYGNYVPALAESWEPNEDASVWTFKLRQGVEWVTSTGDPYAEVTAHDFVAGLQHAADYNSGTAMLMRGVIKNFSEYEAGQVAWEEVGVKAIDDYTLEYTLTSSVPYFYTMTTYAILYPVNEAFLVSKGCPLGSKSDACEFGTMDPASILYNGAYILSEYVAESKVVFTANANYWDTDNVHLQTIEWIYDDGSDPYSVIKGFEAGTYVSAALTAQWEDLDDYLETYKENYYTSLPDQYAFGMNFNFNRQQYEYTSKTTEAEKQATKDALVNANFRRAIMAAFDRMAYLTVNKSEEVATAMLRNINGYPDIVANSKGQNYLTLVNEAYKELTGKEINLADGQDPFYNPEKAMEYIEAAKADGIKFPVRLDIMAIGDDSQVYVDRANALKQSIEKNTEGNIIIDIQLEPKNTVNAVCYTNMDPAASDYDITTFTGWGPDFADPKTFVDVYSTSNGYYMTTLGLNLDADETAEDRAAKDASGLAEYEKYYLAADAIKTDLDARYAAFAKADAYMVAEALIVPMNMQNISYAVSRVVPFSGPYSVAGIAGGKYKYMQVQEEMVTNEQYYEAKEEWLAAKG